MLRATFIFIFSGILLLAGCSADAGKPVRAQGEGAVPVTVATVEQKNMPVDVQAIGSVDAYSIVGVKSQVTGELVGVHFQEGQDVQKGDLLFTIDPRPFQAEVERQDANLARDLAQAENQRAQAKRYEQLFKEGVVSSEQYDQVRTNTEALEATVRADRAALETAKLNMQYTQIHAPISGRTGSLMVNQGNMVRANDTTDLVTIHQVEPIYVSFSVHEQYLPDIKRFMASKGLTVQVAVPGRTERTEGKVFFVDNKIDPSTAMIRLKAVFPNRERHLWPGQYADVSLTLTVQSGAIVVPTRAVQTGQEGDFVFVIDEKQMAQQHKVTVLRRVGDQTIIAEGLNPGQLVVTEGQLRLQPSGTKVQIKPAADNVVSYQNSAVPDQPSQQIAAAK
jgi:membrane fusion protein, multidrug efflux system